MVLRKWLLSNFSHFESKLRLTLILQMPPKQSPHDVQREVDEVVGAMQNNITKVVERGEKLESLQNKTEDLQSSSLQFKRGANTVRKQMWWKDFKMKLIIGGIVAVILLVIIRNLLLN